MLTRARRRITRRGTLKNMKQNIMRSIDKPDCPHCRKKETLCYYREAGNGNDLYYCDKCYGLVEWDGENKKAVEGEAYPNREK